MNRKYGEAPMQFLRDNAPGRTYAELAEEFNSHFGASLSPKNVETLFFNRNLDRSEVKKKTNQCYPGSEKGWFKPGHTPHNAGKKGWSAPGSEKSRFKTGHISARALPLSSERMDRGGYVEVKVSEHGRCWRKKHVLVWEAAHGSIPPGHVVIFADQNKYNFALENLLLVSRAELLIMNRRGLTSSVADLTKTGKLVASIEIRVGEIHLRGKGGENGNTRSRRCSQTSL